MAPPSVIAEHGLAEREVLVDLRRDRGLVSGAACLGDEGDVRRPRSGGPRPPSRTARRTRPRRSSARPPRGSRARRSRAGRAAAAASEARSSGSSGRSFVSVPEWMIVVPPPGGTRIAISAGSKPFGISSTRAAGCRSRRSAAASGRDADHRRRSRHDPGLEPAKHRAAAIEGRVPCPEVAQLDDERNVSADACARRSRPRTAGLSRARRRTCPPPAGSGSPASRREPRASTAASPRGAVRRAGRPGRRPCRPSP